MAKVGSATTDMSLWLSVTEDTLFLLDGLLKVSNLVQLPRDISTGADSDASLVTFNVCDPADLCDKIRAVCRNQNNAHARLLEYRLNALKGLWEAHRQVSLEQCERDKNNREELQTLLKKQGLLHQGEQVSFSSRVSLLLIFPLLQSQSEKDPSLCGVSAKLLLNCLKECPPLSLLKEPSDCLTGLENLLSSWLGEGGLKLDPENAKVKDKGQQETVVSALVALACARGTLNTFLHVIYLLQKLPNLSSLQVNTILKSLAQLEGGVRYPSAVLGPKHVLSWGFDDLLRGEMEKDHNDRAEVEHNRSMTCDGKFLYVTSSKGHGLSKIGTGLHGTLRGFVYSYNTSLSTSCVAYGSGHLLCRTMKLDQEKDSPTLALIINKTTLLPEGRVFLPSNYVVNKNRITIQFCSDGSYFYWITCIANEKHGNAQPIYLDVFKLKENCKEAILVHQQVILQRKEETTSKSLNEALMSHLRPFRPLLLSSSSANALSSSSSSGHSQDATVGITSCGIPLKGLLKCPIYACGNSVVILTPMPGSSSSSSNALFGSSSSISTLRVLASNLAFSVVDGHFQARLDLLDAPFCSLARGASLYKLAICYDYVNNAIWTCSNDYIDQFDNPGHLASHHVYQRLGVDTSQLNIPDHPVSPVDVIRQLLHHVGSMCCHQLACDLPQMPIAALQLLQKKQPVDHAFLTWIISILEVAVGSTDLHLISCSLVVLQVIFKTLNFKEINPAEEELVKTIFKILNQLLNKSSSFPESSFLDGQIVVGVQAEACRCIVAGLGILYPKLQDRNNMILSLLAGSKDDCVSTFLRDLILTEYVGLLQNFHFSLCDLETIRLPDKAIHYLLKIAVKDSCVLLRKCTVDEHEEFEKILLSVPVFTPCMQYLSAYQNCLLKNTLLCDSPDKSGKKKEENVSLKDLQQRIYNFASQVFSSAYEVLEVLLEVCYTLINRETGTELEWRLQGLERIIKATILGCLLPTLVTALTHNFLQNLEIADALMPQLVQLVILTSKAALLLKNQVQAIKDDDLLQRISPDSDVLELIGESLPLESPGELEEKEEAGFLSGLKIPTPWAVGRTVESIHPLRDNYKFKETIHIAGAQCLYLQFDPACSSQYDYDKLVVYAGPSVTSKKVAEFGGNTFGFGSRTVLGNGWPKDLIKVEGDTVTISFEMRSSREDNTPDKAMWGFLIHVRAQESAEDSSGGLPFLADVALGLLVISCSLLQCLYQGPPICEDEITCQQLLQSPLLQRCMWQTASLDQPHASPSPPTSVKQTITENVELHFPVPSLPLSRIRLTSERLKKLRELSGHPPVQLRPSIREILKPDVLEELIISSVIKHFDLFHLVRQMKIQEQTPEMNRLTRIMSETYGRIYALLRRLQMLAELEQQWQTEVEDIVKGVMPAHMSLFAMHHLMESQAKELALLCFIKDVEFDPLNLETVVNTLRHKLECEALVSSRTDPEEMKNASMARTRRLVDGIIERTELLLNVTITTEAEGLKVHSDSAVTCCGRKTRSLSAPGSELEETFDDLALLFQKKHQQHKRMSAYWQERSSILLDDEYFSPEQTNIGEAALLDQLFCFIGSSPEKSVSCSSFLSAAKVRHHRGTSRRQALIHMKELLMAASQVGGATHLVSAVTSVLQQGPKIEELTCGGEVNSVQEAFSETLTLVVQLVAKYPRACISSIGMLCIIPYSRSEEKCLVRSGLVHLLDHLCCFYHCSGDSQSSRRHMADLAWAGFQVLATRCAQWEEQHSPQCKLEHSGLARQVSVLLSNHLTRATDPKNNDMFTTKSLHEVLHLLNSLSKSKMGKAILSQPGCISKLLSLLLDQRPSPKLVLTVLYLCHVALPLMSAEDCARATIPSLNVDMETICPGIDADDQASQIVCLLLAKLGDYVLTGALTGPFCLARKGAESALSYRTYGSASDMLRMSKDDRDKGAEDSDIKDGKLSVFLHKRGDQHAHEVIQPLLSGPDGRLMRATIGTMMERVLKMEREITKYGKGEICTEDAVFALRCAAKWAQNGFVISTGPPVEEPPVEPTTDKKKMTTEAICREKNQELVKSDPLRPFISGHVANSMASEIIGLLHSLLEAPESATAAMWSTAVDKVLGSSVSLLPLILNETENLTSVTSSNLANLLAKARQVTAALCALGGFKESLKPGSEVLISSEGICSSPGHIVNISEERGMATVQLHLPKEGRSYPYISETVHVPLSRLKPPRSKPLPIHHPSLMEQVVNALHALLVPENGKSSPLQITPTPLQPETPSALITICQAVIEIQTRACQVLFQLVQNHLFSEQFMKMSSKAIDVLKILAKECSPGERRDLIESQCERYRMLYFDCAKPPPPPSKASNRSKEITWHPSRAFPPVRASLFSHGMTGITFLGDPSVGSGLPRGTFVYATQAIPLQAPSFYWEIEICSYGDSQDDGGPIVSFGFAPTAEKKEGAWTNPVGTVLLHNNGRAVHYNGSSLLQWKSVRLDVSLRSGDITGCGWERQSDSCGLPPGQVPRGTVFFTHNGRLLPATLDNVAGGMWPVVHIQKKNTRIRANFGGRPFVYVNGQQHRNAADECSDNNEEISANFGLLPFHGIFDSETDLDEKVNAGASGSSEISKPSCSWTVSPPKAQREYNSTVSSLYKLSQSFDNFLTTGPDQHAFASHEEESDSRDDDNPTEDENLYALLVKAWETKVFPVIRRRFRNEGERKDGLEQIKGALQLGMTDIARQTVEFLYEENGGIPRDLHLPTIEDIKEDLSKFTIENLRKGATVMICSSSPSTSSKSTEGNRRTSTSSSSVSRTSSPIPKFAIPEMLETFGLLGQVLEIDSQNELVQVETYLRNEGMLVRYWYPLEMLEKPPEGLGHITYSDGPTLDVNSLQLHKELLRLESSLIRMYCRSALLELIDQCNRKGSSEDGYNGDLTPNIAASRSLLQELDVENLHLLSNELLVSNTERGNVVEKSLISCKNLYHCLDSLTPSPSKLLYNHGSSIERRLNDALSSAIRRAGMQGEDYLLELSNQICLCLQLAPETFPYECKVVTESQQTTEVVIPGAAFLVISCKTEPKQGKKDPPTCKVPWARVFCYGGHHIKKNGQLSKVEVLRYPLDSGLGTSSCISSAASDQYPSVVLACNVVELKTGATPVPNMAVMIHAVPPELPLALAYIEELLRVARQELREVQDDKKIVTPLVLSHLLELVCGYLAKTNIPPFIKERVFHLLAEMIRVVDLVKRSYGMFSVEMPIIGSPLSYSDSLSIHLLTEMRCLFEEETKKWPSADTVIASLSLPSGSSFLLSGNGHFSSYFQALMEVCLAYAEVQSKGSRAGSIDKGVTTVPLAGPSSPTSQTQALLPTSPPASNRRRKLKAKRAASKQANSTTTRSHDSDSTPTPQISKESFLTRSKSEDLLWFHRVCTMSLILRHILYGDKNGVSVMREAVIDANASLQQSTAHRRLLVITGIPQHVSCENAKQAIRKAFQGIGGLYKDELFVPEVNDSLFALKGIQHTDTLKTELVAEEKMFQVARRGSKRIWGYAVIEIRSQSKIEAAKKSICKSKLLLSKLSLEPTMAEEDLIELSEEVVVSTVDQNLQMPDSVDSTPIEHYLMSKILSSSTEAELMDAALITVTEIFHSCFISEQGLESVELQQESGYICLSKEQIMNPIQGNILYPFFISLSTSHNTNIENLVDSVLQKYGIIKTVDKDRFEEENQTAKVYETKPEAEESFSKESTPEDLDVLAKDWEKSETESASTEKSQEMTEHSLFDSDEESAYLTLDGFVRFVANYTRENVWAMWQAFLACGYDLHFDRFMSIDSDHALQLLQCWTGEMDCALVSLVNSFCRCLTVTPNQIHPHEIYLSPAERTSIEYYSLRDIPVESLRLRFAFLQSLNAMLESLFLPLIDLRAADVYPYSTASLLGAARGIIFYDTKLSFTNYILNVTDQRKPEQVAPEIVLDPLQSVGVENRSVVNTHFCQAMRQLQNVPSSQLCVRLASGGDPTYAFIVRYTGEEVHGTSGSFRHFLSQVSQELQGPLLSLLVSSPGSVLGKQRCGFLLKPGPMTFSEEQLLIALGQLFGVTIRADIPLALDMSPCFWKSLLNIPLDTLTDLQEADVITYKFIKELATASSDMEFNKILEEHRNPSFTYHSLNGEICELCPNGENMKVSWENQEEFIQLLKKKRLEDLEARQRIMAVCAGLASVFPLSLLTLHTPQDIELRICGLPEIDLEFLKHHTMYQVGLMETDTHVQYFWNALESFSQDELRKFIKFACNQDRIPNVCPCRNGKSDTVHVPPYPMKIAPPDGRGGSPDSRFIRVETCMFMIKLPQYTTQEMMTEKLLYSIHCREDPLSG